MTRYFSSPEIKMSKQDIYEINIKFNASLITSLEHLILLYKRTEVVIFEVSYDSCQKIKIKALSYDKCCLDFRRH